MKENILVLTGVLGLILIVVWIAVAHRPEPPSPPPLPDPSEVVPAPGATRTPAPDEDASNDVSPPTVTPIPFKEVIDKDKEAPMREKSEIVVFKSNGDYIGTYEYVPFERIIKDADIVVAGEVKAIGETNWNQDSGEYWEETFKDGEHETIVSALPYYEITMSVERLLADSLGIKESQLIITVVGASPVDYQEQASPLHPQSGDEIVAFVRQGEIGWRRGPITYHKEDGSLESGRKATLLLLGGPDNSHLLKNENGLYDRPSAKNSSIDEQVSPMSLDDLTKLVQDKRAR